MFETRMVKLVLKINENFGCTFVVEMKQEFFKSRIVVLESTFLRMNVFFSCSNLNLFASFEKFEFSIPQNLPPRLESQRFLLFQLREVVFSKSSSH